MPKTLKITVSARVPPRTRQRAEALAGLRGATLSGFIAHAVEEATRRELRSDATERDAGTIVTPRRIELQREGGTATTKPRFDRATEIPPQRQAETHERESRPVLEEEVVGSHEPESFDDFPEPLGDDDVDDDDDDDEQLPF